MRKCKHQKKKKKTLLSIVLCSSSACVQFMICMKTVERELWYARLEVFCNTFACKFNNGFNYMQHLSLDWKQLQCTENSQILSFRCRVQSVAFTALVVWEQLQSEQRSFYVVVNQERKKTKNESTENIPVETIKVIDFCSLSLSLSLYLAEYAIHRHSLE